MDGADARMIQWRTSQSLTPEMFECLWVFRQFIGKKLERNLPPQSKVFSLVHHTHATAADFASLSSTHNVIYRCHQLCAKKKRARESASRSNHRIIET